jgi:inner membrane protein involved in colicin E2 resistance
MGQLEILTKLMDSHFIHETCWYDVLFIGLQFLAHALLNVNMAKLLHWQQNATGGDLRCAAVVLRNG